MMRKALSCVAFAALVTSIPPAWGQRPGAVPDSVAPAAPAPPAVVETANLAEQLRVLKALSPLGLSTEQMHSLLGLLKPGRQKLEQQDPAGLRQLAAVIPQLRQALTQAAAQSTQTTPAELEYRRVTEMDRQSRDRLRNQLRDDLRKLIETNFSPEQRSAVISAGHVLNVQQRVQEMAAGDRGPIDGVARQLDQLRQADARTFQQQRQMFAMREANVSNFWVAFQGAQGGPGGPGGRGGQRGFGGQAAPGGQGGQGAGGRRGAQGGDRTGRGGAPDGLQQEQLRQQLNDPAVQARMRPFLAMADQVRRVPMASYQQQRMKLALQVWQTSEEQRVSTNPQASMDYFITQVLLLPAAVDVLEAKLKGSNAG